MARQGEEEAERIRACACAYASAVLPHVGARLALHAAWNVLRATTTPCDERLRRGRKTRDASHTFGVACPAAHMRPLDAGGPRPPWPWQRFQPHLTLHMTRNLAG